GRRAVPTATLPPASVVDAATRTVVGCGRDVRRVQAATHAGVLFLGAGAGPEARSRPHHRAHARVPCGCPGGGGDHHGCGGTGRGSSNWPHPASLGRG